MATAIVIVSCEYDREEEEIVEVDPIDTTSTDTTTSDTTITDTTTTPVVDTYENKVKAIIDLNCAASSGCHGSGSSAGDFTSYAGLKIDVDNGLVKTHIESGYMPYGAAFNPVSDKDVVLKWITDGAKEK